MGARHSRCVRQHSARRRRKKEPYRRQEGRVQEEAGVAVYREGYRRKVWQAGEEESVHTGRQGEKDGRRREAEGAGGHREAGIGRSLRIRWGNQVG